MDRRQLIKLVTEYALAYLRQDDRSPDVGMGMMTETAIKLAEQDIIEEAARWNSFAALSLDFRDIRDEVTLEILKERRRR